MLEKLRGLEADAFAIDLEDGDLSDQLTWSSDLEGTLGTGAALPVTLMVVGTHRIITSATDSHGFTQTSEISLTIELAPPVVTIVSPADGSGVARRNDNGECTLRQICNKLFKKIIKMINC